MSTITSPCIVDGMSDEEYHADPVEGGSLSSTGARAILKSPKRFVWDRTHRRESAAFDVGHAAHAKILGVGLGVVEYPTEHLTPSGNASTKAATVAWATGQRAAGLVPVTPDQIADVDAMAEAVLAHKPARDLLEAPGKSEQSAFAQDPMTGTWIRVRIDRLGDDGTASDLKTTTDANPDEFRRDVAKYGYDVQQEFYKFALDLLPPRLERPRAFRFIVVEKTPPYLVSVNELDAEFEAIGRQRMRRAIDTYKRCRDADEWPGYEEIVHLVDPPRWLAYEEGLGD